MRSHLRTSVAFVALLGIGWLLGNQTSSNGQIPNALNINQWEYTSGGFDVSRANALGKDGWELVVIYVRPAGGANAVYKRRMQPTEPESK